MKMKSILMGAILTFFTVIGSIGANTETVNPLAYLERLDTLFKSSTDAEIKAKLDATQADAVAINKRNIKARYAITKTIIETNDDKTSSFSTLAEKANANYEAVGLPPGSYEAIEMLPLLAMSKYSKSVTDARVDQAIEYLKDKRKADVRTVILMEQRGRDVEALEQCRTSDNWQCREQYMRKAMKTNESAACKQFMTWGIQGQLFPQLARDYGITVINYYLTTEDLDRTAFKKQLNTMLIVYSNKMTNDTKKIQWGAFVAVLKNTINLL